MNEFDTNLKERLDSIRAQGLHRELRRIDSPQGARIEIDGRDFLNFSSNDYLGLANEPTLKEAAVCAVERFGAGSGASRLICGSLAPHHELEETLAAFKGTESALSFSSGYSATLGTICALLGKDDVLAIDKLCHASIVDAARLCGAKLRVFAHNELNELEEILRWANESQRGAAPGNVRPSRRVLIVTESIFSMDGDQARLRELIDLKERYGAWLMLDEAHATGLLGPQRRGLAEACNASDLVEIQMGTLGKALGAAGGYVCGSRVLIDYLVNRSRTFIFSTAPTPATAAAACAGVRFVQSSLGADRCERLWQRVQQLTAAIQQNGTDILHDGGQESAKHFPSARNQSAIIPLIIGDEAKAVEAAAALRSEGIFIPAIRYPTVRRGSARLRMTITATHTSDDIDRLTAALKRLCLIHPGARVSQLE